MKLDETFERVIVINLPFKIARKEKLMKHLVETGLVDPSKIVWQRSICGDWTPAPSWWGAGNGAWGCLMSHVRAAQDAVHDDLANYCVLEDDVLFHPRAAEMLEHFIREVPDDWGQLYLGGQFLHREPEQISPWVMRPYNVNRTHAFALSKNTIPSFLQHVLHAPDYFDVRIDPESGTVFTPNDFHIDHQLGRAHERQDWNVYAPSWWIAGQGEGSSNISGRTNVEMWWHWRDRGHSLPFLYLTADSKESDRQLAERHLHVGYNTYDNSMVDIGLTRRMSDGELTNWLHMIAGEAIERWRLPGLEVPEEEPNLLSRIEKLWKPGVESLDEKRLRELSDYPFNGLCGGIPADKVPISDNSPALSKAG